MNILKALGLTIAIALTTVLLMAALYISVWVIMAVAIILLFMAILKIFRAKDHLVKNSEEL